MGGAKGLICNQNAFYKVRGLWDLNTRLFIGVLGKSFRRLSSVLSRMANAILDTVY